MTVPPGVAPYIQPVDPTTTTPPGDTPQLPPPALPPPAIIPVPPAWPPKGDEIVNPPPDDK